MNQAPENSGKRAGCVNTPLGIRTIPCHEQSKVHRRYRAANELGFKAVKDRYHISDLHATLYHLMGLHHERLTYPHSGDDLRLMGVGGQVIEDALA